MMRKIILVSLAILGLALLSLPSYALDLAPTIAENITTRSAIYYEFNDEGVQYAQTVNIANLGSLVSINAGYGVENLALTSAEINLSPAIAKIPYVNKIFNTPIIGKYIAPSVGCFYGLSRIAQDNETKQGLILSVAKISF